MTNASRARRSRSDKHDARRAELVESALRTLAELGYARTSVRDIAHNSEYSHGVLHYYFADKSELIAQCMERYRDLCVERYDEISIGGATLDEFTARFVETMVRTLLDDAPQHRMWYDLRSQAMFEEQFRRHVADIRDSLERMVERLVARYAELAGRPAAIDPSTAYAMLDGVFEAHVVAYFLDEPDVPDSLRRALVDFLERVTAS